MIQINLEDSAHYVKHKSWLRIEQADISKLLMWKIENIIGGPVFKLPGVPLYRFSYGCADRIENCVKI